MGLKLSFTTRTKIELAKVHNTKRCCRIAELGAMIYSCGALNLYGKGHMTVSIATEHEQVAGRLTGLLKSLYGVMPVLKRSERSQPKKLQVFVIELAPAAKEGQLLFDIGLLKGNDTDYRLNTEPDFPGIFDAQCCRDAFMRGVFLGSGILSDPNKSYQLEFVLNNQDFAGYLCNMLQEQSIGAKLVQRKNKQVVYLKNIEQILDILIMAGAHSIALEIENIRVVKDVRNQINRQGNCDNANIDKMVRAVGKQRANIEYIQQEMGLEKLSPALREACECRLNYPEQSLAQLAEMLDGVSRSGLNNRFRKINEIAEELRQQKGV